MQTRARLALVFLVALLLMAVLMFLLASFDHPGHTIRGLKPGVEMEFAAGQHDTDTLLRSASSTPGRNNRLTMTRQQYFDFVFILLYVVFLCLVARAVRPRWLGVAAGISVVAAGAFDYLEDFAILAACRGDAGQTIWPVTYGTPKWLLFFVTVGLLGYPLFTLQTSLLAANSALTLLMERIAGALFLAGGVTGAMGVIFVRCWRQGSGLLGGFLEVVVAFVILLVGLSREACRPAAKDSGHATTT